MTLDEMKALAPGEKHVLRRNTRRALTAATRELLRPQPAEKRAFLYGYLERAREALEALS